MQLIAHRGLINSIFKENTLEAFKNALNNGYDGIELDVRVTKDNKLVVIHNNLINKTSNGTGSVNNYTYKELLKFNFGSSKRPAKIPLLSNVISKISNTIVFVELKEKVELEDIESILDKNTSNTYYISSFNKKIIDQIKKTKYKKGLINYVFNYNIDIKDYDFMLVLEDLFTENIKKYLLENNVEPVIYGVLNKVNVKKKDIIANLKIII